MPAEGRAGEPPDWPLTDPLERELVLWAGLWRLPQAVMWNGVELEVAMHVRTLVTAEALDAPVTARTLVRQQQEGLGLSIPGMLRNRWRIVDAPDPERAQRKRRSSASSRLRVVDDVA